MMRYITRPRFNCLDVFVAAYATLLLDSPMLSLCVLLGGALLSSALELFFWARKK